MMKSVSAGAAKPLVFSISIALGSAWAQPSPAPAAGDLKCTEEANVVGTDTVASAPDEEGYLSLFDGTFKGWFQSCKTTHSSGSNQGAVFRIGSADGKPAIYSTQRGSGTGGVMMTNKKFTNYELVIDFWPDYGNDGGIFNRTTMDGVCFQTVLDYIGSGSVGGMWAEHGYTGGTRDIRPWKYNSESSLQISGTGSWTATTQKLKATTEPDIPCPSTGCTQSDYLSLWNTDGWNMIKVQFYGGSRAGTGNVHMKSWFKRSEAKVWIPILYDTTLNYVTPPGYIGLQVHGGGRFGGAKGTWYRSIKWKPLDDKGMIPVGLRYPPAPAGRAPNFKFTAGAAALTGTIDMDYTIEVRDAAGRRLESFSGKAGAVRHNFATASRGVLLLGIRTAYGSQTARVARTAL